MNRQASLPVFPARKCLSVNVLMLVGEVPLLDGTGCL